jgi:two-component system NtrC family sensor kinase
MLRTKLFWAFMTAVLIVGILSAILGIRMIRNRLVEEAQTRVTLDLGSAWAASHAKLDEIQTILKLVASKKLIVDACSTKAWENAEVQNRLELTRTNFKLDFLTLVDPDGKVVLRAAPPYARGDFLTADPAVSMALRGELATGFRVLGQSALQKEAEGMAERALLKLEDTRYARPRIKTEESRGLVMVAAAPVREGGQILGVMYGGVLLTRNNTLVDRIKEIVFKNEDYKGHSMGTATMFLNDCRIATTVRLPNGNRALGTRASKEVSDRVLDNAMPWIGRAFVVNDWYLTAYDPIRDIEGHVVGMLYVGLLEKPFTDVGRSLILRYALLLLLGVTLALWLAFVMAGRLAAPIHRLVEAAQLMHQGGRPQPLPIHSSCIEVERLVESFNEMAVALSEREDRLKAAKTEVEETNESLKALNRNYMETLGFVSHELKNPLSTMMNYVYLLKGSFIGPVTEKQQRAVNVLETNTKRLVEMVRHYLNLSRIENRELQPMLARVLLHEDVIQPLLETMLPDIETHRLKLDNRMAPDIALHADVNMVREVFENLISNAVKYGREGGALSMTAVRADGFYRFAVRNDGEGIPLDKLDKVFQKFTRLNTQTMRHQKGTGLGLFITRAIIEAHGGTIEVESHPNEWVEFRFTLRVEA